MKVNLTAKNVRIKKGKKKPGVCSINVCIDERTGQLKFIAPGKDCPPGFRRRMEEAVRDRGVMFPPVDDEA
jgi:hypothetical protein